MSLKIRVVFLFLFYSISCIVYASDTAMSVKLKFYSEQLSVRYNPDMIIKTSVALEEESIVQFYKLMERTNYQGFLSDLKHHQQSLRLNDWLFYDLLNEAIELIYNDKTELQKTLTAWFILSKAGYDTRLTYYANSAFVYVYSNESVFEVPMIQDNDRTFINLTSFQSTINTNGVALDMLLFNANRTGRAFSFDMSTLPKLSPKIDRKNIQFMVGDKEYSFTIDTDLTIKDLMKKYPIIDEHKYLEIPISKTISASLIPELSKLIKGKSKKEALEILVSFTRTAFNYKEDHEFFGKSKPMIADEVFHYPFSDCEDRSALFYSLVKALLDLPMLVIAYPDHLTIAVSLSEAIGPPIVYNGLHYYICDPTGPSNSKEIGRAPRGYEGKSFEILALHK